ATNATPIVITTAAPHGLATGWHVWIGGVAGNTNANGSWVVTVVAPTTFRLNGSQGNAGYAGGGTWLDLDRFRLNGSTTNGAYTGGGTWVKANDGVNPSGQGGYYSHFSFLADPDMPSTVYIGGDLQPLISLIPTNFVGAKDYSGRLFRGNTTVARTGDIPSPQWEHLTHSNMVAAIPGGGT